MKTTLQARLIILMVLASIFLISAFTAIQLNNQLQKAQELNVFRAKQAAFLARDELERIFSTLIQGQPQVSPTDEIKKLFVSLLASESIETAVLLDKEGKPVVLEGNLKLVFEDEKNYLKQISETTDKSKWLVPVIDKEHKLVSLFVVFNNTYGYVVKLVFSLGNLQQALNEVYGPVFFTVIIVVIANIILATLLSKALISPVKLLNQATKGIAAGNLDLKVSIETKDELEELADTFNYMTVELKKMKERAENANPLTKLPGNIVIQEEVEKKIKSDAKFVLIYSDLDNFKAFNDKYGVHAGDKAIMLTADAMKEAVAKEGKEGDFVGHEGGDDFLLLTTPERAEKIAYYILKEFDTRIKGLYSKEDLDRGYIEAKARDSEEIKKFPIMTISLAGVSNIEKKIDSYAQLTNVAAEIKKAAKKIKESKFLLDRRVVDLGTGFRGKAEEPSEDIKGING